MSPDASPSPQRTRIQYDPPRLTVYGNVRELTQTLGSNSTRPDGGGGTRKNSA